MKNDYPAIQELSLLNFVEPEELEIVFDSFKRTANCRSLYVRIDRTLYLLGGCIRHRSIAKKLLKTCDSFDSFTSAMHYWSLNLSRTKFQSLIKEWGNQDSTEFDRVSAQYYRKREPQK